AFLAASSVFVAILCAVRPASRAAESFSWRVQAPSPRAMTVIDKRIHVRIATPDREVQPQRPTSLRSILKFRRRPVAPHPIYMNVAYLSLLMPRFELPLMVCSHA